MSWKDWCITTVALFVSSGFVFRGCVALANNVDFALNIAIAVFLLCMVVALVFDTAIGKLNATLERGIAKS